MRDEKTFWVNGVKTKLRKFYLTVFLKEAHELYTEMHPNNHVGYSKFCELRSKNVLLLHETPADQCKCKFHENFLLKLKALKVTYDSKAFWKSYLCDDSHNSKCWENLCLTCKNGQLFKPEIINDTIVNWKEWSTKKDCETRKQMKMNHGD